MPSYSALVLACTIVAAVRALPVDEISARNDLGTATSGVGGQAAGDSVSAAASRCISPFTECALSEVWGTSLLKMGSGKHTRIIPLHVDSDTHGRECRERGQRALWSPKRKSVVQTHRRHQLD